MEWVGQSRDLQSLQRLRRKLELLNLGWPKPERTTSTVLLTGNETAEIYIWTLWNTMPLHLAVTGINKHNGYTDLQDATKTSLLSMKYSALSLKILPLFLPQNEQDLRYPL